MFISKDETIMTGFKSLTLKIDEEQGNYAKVLSSQMSTPEIRKKGMIDLLGITSVVNFLSAQKIKVDLNRSLHKTPLLLEEFKISDLYYNNHRMDVITIFREKKIRIPRIHADLDILSDFYIVAQIGSKLKEAKILGWLKTSDVMISKNDNKFYYPPESKLRPIEDLIKQIRIPKPEKQMKGKHIECISLFLRFLDNELSNSHKKEMVQHILSCESCLKRLEDLIEFDRVAHQTRKYPNTVERYYQKISSTPIKTSSKKYPNVVMKKGIKDNTQDDIIINPIKILPATPKKKLVSSAGKPYSDILIKEAEKKSSNKSAAIETIFKEDKKLEGSDNIVMVKGPTLDKKKIAAILSAIVLVLGLITFAFVKKTNDLALISDVNNPNPQEQKGYDKLSSGDGEYEAGYDDLGIQNLPSSQVASGGIDYELLNTFSGEPIIANINKISWEVSENIAEKDTYKKFLQMVGKNIKLNLQNDLLLTNEFAKNNTIKVDIKFSGSGNIESIKIRESSGSNQIDNIIKKSIGETLSYMKPPNLGLIGKSVEVTLIISL